MKTETYQLPNEPTRFSARDVDKLLGYCSRINASDITLQTDELVIVEVYGRLHKISKHKLSNSEVGDILNAIYGPNGTAQILSGLDVDTHYEFRPTRTERYRYRVNGTGCQVAGHHAIQLTLRTIPSDPPPLKDMELPPDIVEAIAPQEGVVYVTGATGSGKTTLLASIIGEIAKDPESHRKILTYESPIEFVYDTFPRDERIGRTIDIIETLRLIIWQKLVPTVDGKRVALREYLIFNEEVRNILLEADPNEVTAITRRLVKEKGQPMIVDVKKKFADGIISERDFKILSAGTKDRL